MRAARFGFVALLLVPINFARCEPITYDFQVNGGPTGPLANVVVPGSFSFDEAVLPVGGSGVVAGSRLLLDLTFDWNGLSYSARTANIGWLAFDDGALTNFSFGSNCAAGICSIAFGSDDWFIGQAGFSYGISELNAVFAGAMLDLERRPVPGPAALTLFGLAIAGLWMAKGATRPSLA